MADNGAPKLLITGSEGTIGAVLRKALTGYDILRLDIVDAEGDDYVRADISRERALKDALFPHLPIDSIVHLAGDPRVDAPWESVLPANIIGARNIFEFAASNGVRRVVFASSNHVTGHYEGIPPELHTQPDPELTITTRMPVAPDGYYGVSKAFGEILAKYLSATHDLSTICLRIGMVTKDDTPFKEERGRSVWLSHRDLVQLVERSLAADVKFGVYYGVSDNARNFWDISNVREDLGYEPQDNAERFFQD